METELTLKLNNKSISRNDDKSNFSYSPLVNELSGIIHLEENFDYKSDYTSYLDKKSESRFHRC